MMFDCKKLYTLLNIDKETLHALLGLHNFEEVGTAYNVRNQTLESNHPVLPQETNNRIHALTRFMSAMQNPKDGIVRKRRWLNREITKGGTTPVKLMSKKGDIGLEAIEAFTKML